MKKFTFTTKLNFKIVSIVLLSMMMVTAYTHWLSLQEENDKNSKLLIAITDFLVKKIPDGSFSRGMITHDMTKEEIHEQILLTNQELQPLLNNLFVPPNIIKFGFYSRQQESIVAIGPQYDASLLSNINTKRLQEIYSTDSDQLIEKKSFLLWHGANSMIHVQPIKENGVIIGHAFASINQDAVSAIIWKRTINTLLGAFLMLLICVVIFRELFVKLKTDLEAFAEAILDGNTSHFHSEIAEFTPILNYISEQTEKMTRLDRLNIIGEMAAGIAHEIRNPMTTVRGLLQFIGNKHEFVNQKENFELMINEIDRANSIITEFLSLAKNRAMEFSENNLNNIIHDIYPLLQADALRNNCDIHLALDNIPNVSVDPNSIRQLILNLVRNGIDAIQESGLIEIHTKTDSRKVYLSIKDSGIGIPPEIKDQLGTPFFTTKEKGTGLGLAICFRIVQRHSAILMIDSELGKGSIFTIAFNIIE
ncbi:signal transduction histidine kinase [Sporomusaceae bacterium BoRhaA]|uniref:ATP-binding protein n=1 Tax=Pelorhabdus rhamnosifermentans TaxID=2772457 RepID=UPI001C061AA7|nr:ATP-binding protein [Pelorhabdus rhamnosifermentans]MBU2701856.1 signal transduction histidine kinase [Pelorhabdus rhamnosifermentans]